MTVSTTAASAAAAVGQREDRVLPLREATEGRPVARARGRLRPAHAVLAADVVVAAAAVMAVAPISRPGTTLGVGLAVAWLLALAATRSYDHRLDPTVAERARPVLRAAAVLGLGCWLLLPAVVSIGGSVHSLLRLPAMLTVGGLVTHVALPGLLHSLTGRPARRQSIVVVGHRSQVEQAVAELARTGTRGPEITAVEVDDRTSDVTRRVLQAVAEQTATAVVALPGPGLGPVELRRLGWGLEDGPTQLLVATGLVDVTAGRTASTSLGGMRVLHVRPRDAGVPRRLVKEAVERTAAALVLLLLLPLLVVIGLAVRLTSPGPAIFRQTRVGLRGSEFTMYKFRTMCADAERVRASLVDDNECDAVLFKLRRDPRITRVGGILRRYSLDELPQLVNVVLGQMSLVGPRPALPAEVSDYEEDPRRRLVVKPGLTGLWQVSGRSDLTWEESVRLDLRYVDNWSLALDAEIVLRTVGAVLNKRGAY